MFKKILLSTALIATVFSSSLVFAEEDIKLQQNDFDLTSDYEAMSKLFKEQFGDFPTTWDEQYFNEIKNKCITKGDYTDCYTEVDPYNKRIKWIKFYKGDKSTGQVGTYQAYYYRNTQKYEIKDELELLDVSLYACNNNTYWWNEAVFSFDCTENEKNSLSSAELATAATWGTSLRIKYQKLTFDRDKHYLLRKVSSDGLNEDKTSNVTFDLFNPLTNRFYKINRKVDAVDLSKYDVFSIDRRIGDFILKSKTTEEYIFLDNYDHITEYKSDLTVKQQFDIVWKRSMDSKTGKVSKNLILKNWLSYDDNNQVNIQAAFNDDGQIIEGFRVNNAQKIPFSDQEKKSSYNYLQKNLQDFYDFCKTIWLKTAYNFLTEDF